MWTKKTHFVMITFRFGFFRLPIILPMRALHEIVEGYSDFFSLFKWIGDKVYSYLQMAQGALLLIKDYEPLDLVDIDATHTQPDGKKKRVKIKVITR